MHVCMTFTNAICVQSFLQRFAFVDKYHKKD